MRASTGKLLRLAVVTAALALAGGAGLALAGSEHSSAAGRVTVTVSDKSLSITSKIHTGRETFVVENRGTKAHELAISGPNVSERTLKLAAGKSAQLIAVLGPGRYRLWDPLVLGRAKGKTVQLGAGAVNHGLGAIGGAGTTTGPRPTSSNGPTITQICDSLSTGQATCVPAPTTSTPATTTTTTG